MSASPVTPGPTGGSTLYCPPNWPPEPERWLRVQRPLEPGPHVERLAEEVLPGLKVLGRALEGGTLRDPSEVPREAVPCYSVYRRILGEIVAKFERNWGRIEPLVGEDWQAHMERGTYATPDVQPSGMVDGGLVSRSLHGRLIEAKGRRLAMFVFSEDDVNTLGEPQSGWTTNWTFLFDGDAPGAPPLGCTQDAFSRTPQDWWYSGLTYVRPEARATGLLSSLMRAAGVGHAPGVRFFTRIGEPLTLETVRLCWAACRRDDIELEPHLIPLLHRISPIGRQWGPTYPIQELALPRAALEAGNIDRCLTFAQRA